VFPFVSRYSYLDTHGRTVLVLKMRNVIDEHNVRMIVTYRMAPLAMLREPFLLVAGGLRSVHCSCLP
jgi:Ribophorin I